MGSHEVLKEIPPMIITNSRINGSVNFHDYYPKFINLTGTIFVNDVNFNDTIFPENITFKNAIFMGYTNFSNTSFMSKIDFSDTEFKKITNFEKVNFQKESLFINASFCKVIFRNCKFNLSEFLEATFYDYANFADTEFFKNVLFERANFLGRANFDNATFAEEAHFDEATIEGAIQFQDSKFDGIADFSEVVFADSNFYSAYFNKEAYFNDAVFTCDATFDNCRFVDDALFQGSSFKSRITLARSRYNNLYIRWDNISKGLEYDESSYQLLIGNFKKLGFYADAENCYYQFRLEQFFRRDLSEEPITYFIDFGAWIFSGFGMKPIYPVIWSVYFIIIFSIYLNSIKSDKSMNIFIKWMLISNFLIIILYIILWDGNLIVFLPMTLVILFLIVSINRINKYKNDVEQYIADGIIPKSFSEAFYLSLNNFFLGIEPVNDLLDSQNHSKIIMPALKEALLLESLLGILLWVSLILCLAEKVIRPF